MTTNPVDLNFIAFTDLIADAKIVAEKVIPHLSDDLRALCRDTLASGGKLQVLVEFTAADKIVIRIVLEAPDGLLVLFTSEGAR